MYRQISYDWMYAMYGRLIDYLEIMASPLKS